jgi:biopolymer transport protein ExbB/TolQ
MADNTKDTRFFEAINRSALAINQAAAGAGVIGLLGFAALLALSLVFFITETFFLSMLILSIGLLVYVSGSEVTKILMSSFTMFFSSKHLTPKAVQLQETLVALQDILVIRRDRTGEVKVGPIEQGARMTLPDNALVRDIKTLLEHDKQTQYAEYIAHSYYVECHELYDHSAAHLEFVSNAIPLFGLMGTVLGLMQMFDSLGSIVSVEALAPQLALAFKCTLYGALFASVYKILAARFDQRLKSLDYDFETMGRALEVLIDHKVSVEVGR